MTIQIKKEHVACEKSKLKSLRLDCIRQNDKTDLPLKKQYR